MNKAPFTEITRTNLADLDLRGARILLVFATDTGATLVRLQDCTLEKETLKTVCECLAYHLVDKLGGKPAPADSEELEEYTEATLYFSRLPANSYPLFVEAHPTFALHVPSGTSVQEALECAVEQLCTFFDRGRSATIESGEVLQVQERVYRHLMT